MGHMSGVAKRLQDEEPAAIAVHCLAHSVNLVLQDITKLCRPVKDALDVEHDCVKFLEIAEVLTVVSFANFKCHVY